MTWYVCGGFFHTMGKCLKSLHLEARETVSQIILLATNMFCTKENIVLQTCKHQRSSKTKQISILSGLGVDDKNYTLITLNSQKRTFLLHNSALNMRMPNTIGNISRKEMSFCFQESGHSPKTHFVPKIMLKPTDFAASVKN